MKRLPLKKLEGDADVPARLKALNASEPHAVLCTVGQGSAPYSSLVAFALTPDLRGLLFATPRDTTKYRNMLGNENVSLLVDTRSNTRGDYLKAEAVTITGVAHPLRRGGNRDKLGRVLTAKHPALSEFVNAEGTALVLVEIRECLHVTGFQKVTGWKP